MKLLINEKTVTLLPELLPKKALSRLKGNKVTVGNSNNKIYSNIAYVCVYKRVFEPTVTCLCYPC